MKFFIAVVLWCLLLAVCWPLALLLFFLLPILWLLLLPFRLIGFTLELVFQIIGSILLFPFRALR